MAITRIMADLGAASIYLPCTELASDIVSRHNDFLTRYSLPVDVACQDMPHYRGHRKLHKKPLAASRHSLHLCIT